MRFIAAVTIAAVMFLIYWLIPSSRRKKIRRWLGIVGCTLVISSITATIFAFSTSEWEWLHSPTVDWVMLIVWTVLLSLWVKRWKMFKPEPSKPVVDVHE